MTDEPAGLRLDALRQWLAAEGVTDGSPLSAELLAGGRSNVSYRVRDAAGADLVVRRPPLGHVMPTAHDMGREYRVMRGLGSVGFPTPRARALCEDVDIIGAPFMVMDFVSGRVIAEANDTRGLTVETCAGMSAALVGTLADLHRIDPATAGLGDLGRPDGYLERQVRRWGQQWELSKTRELASIGVLHEWLQREVAALPANLPSGIVHGDYRIDNVIWEPDEPKIAAVVDWEMATLGDPVSDLAIALVYWSQAGDTLRALVPVAEHITVAPGFWDRAQVIDAYADTTGWDLGHLDFCIVLACFKLAVIMESIHKRNLDGLQLGAAGGRGSRMGEATGALTQLGLATMESGAAALAS